MPSDTSEAIPLLAQIHLRAREHKQELWDLAVRAFRAGAAPSSIAQVMGLREGEVSQLEQMLSGASADSGTMNDTVSVSHWDPPASQAS
ncbi:MULTISPECIES: hypothetical protein [Streptacidiphilus]|uniref:Uncharacterized protein n=1 Tax=Streptacidiphilus cavernicola TaxID=3342716 RepID=A0ABV6UF16_9ACTN|nr:hypothetical protein [Streptacidiphilus jeojiense]